MIIRRARIRYTSKLISEKGTLDVETFIGWHFAITRTEPDELFFVNDKEGPERYDGFINRYTGRIVVSAGKPEHSFDGFCRKAEPLF
jgi:hypothetical protein